MIQFVKRHKQQVGPYIKISVFEALNRIGSDLVLLSGATKLFNGELDGIKPETIQLRMGAIRGFDFEVTLKNKKVLYGEAFNAAESFCKEKMRQTIHKLIDDNPDKKAKEGIVFINEEVKSVIENYANKKEINSKIIIHKVYCNNIK